MGGEPLLHRDLVGVIEAVHAVAAPARVSVVTNGTLLPQMTDAFWRAIDGVQVCLYPGKELGREELRACGDKAKAHGVRLVATRINEFRESYSELGTEDEGLVREIYEACTLKTSHSIARGSFYKCPPSYFLPRVLDGARRRGRAARCPRPRRSASRLPRRRRAALGLRELPRRGGPPVHAGPDSAHRVPRPPAALHRGAARPAAARAAEPDAAAPEVDLAVVLPPRAAADVDPYPFGGERVPDHPPSPPAPDRRAARARPRDDPLGRRSRDAALRRTRGAAKRAASRHVAAHGRRRRPRVRGAAPRRRRLGDPLRHPGGEGRRGHGRLDPRRDRPAGAARAPGPVPRAPALHRRVPLRVHIAWPLWRSEHWACGCTTRRGGRQRRLGRAARTHGRLPRRGRRRRRLPERHDGRPRRSDPRRVAGDADRLLRRQVRLGLLPGRSGKPPARRRRSETGADTRWIRGTCARRCASASSTWPRGPTR